MPRRTGRPAGRRLPPWIKPRVFSGQTVAEGTRHLTPWTSYLASAAELAIPPNLTRTVGGPYGRRHATGRPDAPPGHGIRVRGARPCARAGGRGARDRAPRDRRAGLRHAAAHRAGRAGGAGPGRAALRR